MLRNIALVCGVIGLAAHDSRGAYIVNFSQVGDNVVAAGAGSLNTSGLSNSGSFSTSLGVNPSSAFVAPGIDHANETLYSVLSTVRLRSGPADKSAATPPPAIPPSSTVRPTASASPLVTSPALRWPAPPPGITPASPAWGSPPARTPGLTAVESPPIPSPSTLPPSPNRPASPG